MKRGKPNDGGLPERSARSGFDTWVFRLIAALSLAGMLGLIALLVPQYPYDAGDWQLRCRELQVLRSGIDPFDVFSRRVQVPGYVSLLDAVPGQSAVHYYPPWTYGFCIWAAWLGDVEAQKCAAGAGNAAALLALVWMMFLCARRRTGRIDQAAAVTVLALLLDIFPLYRTFEVGNFSIVAAAAGFAMILLLERKHDMWAGWMLALLMLKIQIGFVFVVPLVIGRRWRTLAVGGILCFLAACIPAWFTGKSPVLLGWQLLYSGDPSFLSPYSGGLFSVFARQLSASVLMAANAAVSIGGLIWVSWRLRFQRDWLWKLLPAAAVVPLWSYSQAIDLCLLLIPLVYFLVMFVRDGMRPSDVLSPLLFSVGLGHALWNVFVLSGRLCRPDGIGWIFIGYLTVCYFGWLGVLYWTTRRADEHGA